MLSALTYASSPGSSSMQAQLKQEVVIPGMMTAITGGGCWGGNGVGAQWGCAGNACCLLVPLYALHATAQCIA